MTFHLFRLDRSATRLTIRAPKLRGWLDEDEVQSSDPYEMLTTATWSIPLSRTGCTQTTR